MTCVTVIINLTLKWLAIDRENLAVAKIGCSRHFEDAPCLKKFIKTEENVYRAICGKEEK